MGTFEQGRDPRRRVILPGDELAQQPLSRATIPPQIVSSDHIAAEGIFSTRVNFDRACFAFDQSTYGGYTVAGFPSWTKIGGAGAGNDLLAFIGPTDVPYYAWVWGSINWGNAGVGDAGRLVATLYQSGDANASAYQRASNYSASWITGDDNYRQMTYSGFFLIPVIEDADWHIGMQHQYVSNTHGSNQKAGRQTLIVFLTAAPPDAGANTTVDGDLGS